MDWNVLGADVITRLIPVFVLVLVYYLRAWLTVLSPLAVNMFTMALTIIAQGLDALLGSGTFNPVQSAALFGLATGLREVLKNTGAEPAVKKALLITSPPKE